MNTLIRILGERDDQSTIVFVNKKASCDYLAKTLEKEGYKCTTLHGGKAQDQRESALETFRNKRADILVATNVAGRGIDVQDVGHVINFDMAHTIEVWCATASGSVLEGSVETATGMMTIICCYRTTRIVLVVRAVQARRYMLQRFSQTTTRQCSMIWGKC